MWVNLASARLGGSPSSVVTGKALGSVGSEPALPRAVPAVQGAQGKAARPGDALGALLLAEGVCAQAEQPSRRCLCESVE